MPPPFLWEHLPPFLGGLLLAHASRTAQPRPGRHFLWIAPLRRPSPQVLRLQEEAPPERVHFPGGQPVSLDRANLGLFRTNRYWVTWKADGTRYLLLLCRWGAYLLDRSFSVRRVQVPASWSHTSHAEMSSTARTTVHSCAKLAPSFRKTLTAARASVYNLQTHHAQLTTAKHYSLGMALFLNSSSA